MLDLSTREDPTHDRSPELTVSGSGDLGAVSRAVRHDGFAFVGAPIMRGLVEAAGGRSWDAFRASWEDLGSDCFMADGGTYRRRRFGCFAVTAEAIRIKPPQSHFQTVEDNPLNGGVDRTFEPVLDRIALHPMSHALIEIGRTLFAAALSAGARIAAWHVEMHQFRIEAGHDAVGQPTPEGLHRDGVDGVMMMMVGRENIAGGESTIADAARRPLRRATLSEPFDAAFVDDRRVFHGVSAVRPQDPARPAFRDVLVLTFRAEEA